MSLRRKKPTRPKYETLPLPFAEAEKKQESSPCFPTEETEETTEAAKRPKRHIYIGVAGWSYGDWVETVYPQNLPPFRRLEYIAQYFDCIEVNSTFYAIPRRSQTAKWASQVPEDFLFTCKIPRTFTHEGGDLQSEALSFRKAIEPLEESGKLGCLLAQFPWYFKFTPESMELLKLISDLFRSLPLVIEVRHRSFLNRAFLDFLQEHSVGLANIDLPSSRTSLPPTEFAFGPCAYFRLHGRNSEAWFDPEADRDEKYNYLYSVEELRPWADRIRRASLKAEKVFVIANNHYRGQAPANALDVAFLLGEIRPAPEPLLRTYPYLAERLEEEGKQQNSKEEK